MSAQRLENVNIAGLSAMPTPLEVQALSPLSERGANTISAGRAAVRDILERKEPRLLLVIGPCSIHDPAAALEYAGRLLELSRKVERSIQIVMRVYFEKPRTHSGWKGFINDPNMDDSFRIEEGIVRARKLLVEFAEMGLPTASEALDPLSPQYLGDLISWYAIGARTTESQTHREMASGLSAPVGFKNGTDGGLEVAINAIRAASQPHSFLGISPSGNTAVVRTTGNRHGHLVLRGGGGWPNYDTVSVRLAERALNAAKLPQNIVIDCSHANSLKDHSLQPLVFHDCVHQVNEGNRSIVGLMVESNLHAGSQAIPEDRSQLKYGVSVTDPCVDWATTEDMVLRGAEDLKPGLARRA